MYQPPSWTRGPSSGHRINDVVSPVPSRETESHTSLPPLATFHLMRINYAVCLPCSEREWWVMSSPATPPPHNPRMLSSRTAVQFLSLHRCTGLPHLRCRHLDFIQANDKAGSKSESSEGQHSAIATLSKQHSSLNHSCYYWKSEVINVSLSTFSLALLYSIPNTWWPSHVLTHYIFKLRRCFWHLLAWLQTHFYYHDIFFMTVLFFSSSNKTGVQKYIPKIVPLTSYHP